MSSRIANPVNNRLLYDKEGVLLLGGTLEFYAAGTSTALEVYSDEELTVSAGSILTADSFGLLPDFHLASGTKYKLIAKDSTGSTEWTVDDVFSIDSNVDVRLDTIENTLEELNVARNAILNGGMRVDLGSDRTLDAAFGEGKVSRLWGRVTNVTAGTLTQSASTAYASGKYGHFTGVSTSSAGLVESQFRVPSDEAARFVDGSGTFSCIVRHDVGSDVTYTVTIKKPTSTADDFTALSVVSTSPGTAVPSDTDTRLSFSVVDLGDVSNGIAIEVSASVSAITLKGFRISEAQLEGGESRSAFTEEEIQVTEAALGKWRDRSLHTGTQSVGTITGLGALATLNTVGTSQIDNNSVTSDKIPSAAINSTSKFPAPVAGTAIKHWESIASGWVSNHGAISFVAQLTGTVTVVAVGSLGTGMVISDNAGATISSTGTGTTSVNLSVTKGLRYFVLDGTAINEFEVRTGNDTAIAAVI